MHSARKSLLIAALGACLPLFMSDVQASGAPVPQPESPNAAGGASGDAQSLAGTSAGDAATLVDAGDAGEQSPGSSTSATGTSAEPGNVQSGLNGSSTAAELPADGAPLVMPAIIPNAPASDAATQSGAATGATALDASGASDAALGDKAADRHPAHNWLDLLLKELETNPFATYARELIGKVRDTL